MSISLCRLRLFSVVMVIITLATTGCNLPRRSQATPLPEGYIYTAAAQTVAAESSGTIVPTETASSATSTFPTASLTVGTATQTAAAAGMKTPTPTPLCNQVKFIEDISVPDNTEFPPGYTFEKTWRLRNVGTCTWSTQYGLVFEGENIFSAPASLLLTNGPVSPGDTVDVTVTLKAPQVAGQHRQDFKLVNATGQKFGLGSDASKPFWVQVRVVSQTGLAYDFVTRAGQADWKSGQGQTLDTNLDFGGSDGDTQGTVNIKDSVRLENGSTSGKLLLTFPKHVSNGVIAGIYPSYVVQSGDHLKARLGFMDDPDGSCDAGAVIFQIGYKQGTSVYSLGEWRKKCDGTFTQVNIDLANLIGKSIEPVLLVRADGAFDGDWAVWNSPRIER